MNKWKFGTCHTFIGLKKHSSTIDIFFVRSWTISLVSHTTQRLSTVSMTHSMCFESRCITLILCTTFHAKHSSETESNALLWLQSMLWTKRALISFLACTPKAPTTTPSIHLSVHPSTYIRQYRWVWVVCVCMAVSRGCMISCASALLPFFHLRQRIYTMYQPMYI